ncbi:MAG: two-component sensor histidine kinase [Cyanobium sp. NAT70]|nr:two-component sensor histidine kinase [Cyanobium sp. NAT70]
MKLAVSWWRLIIRISLWSGLLLGAWVLCLLLLQVLFGRQLERLQTVQLGRELALNVRLTELTLERYPPVLINELTGLKLAVMIRPPRPRRDDPGFDHRIVGLQRELCSRLSHCPKLLPAEGSGQTRQVWIELISPLEPVWLQAELPTVSLWPPEPMLLVVGLVGAVIIAGGVYLLMEVERPLRGLERALSRVGDGSDPPAVPAQGAPEVQRITHRFNAMVLRLAANRRERATMLAGIAHDLRAPITRLRFRLSMPRLDQPEKDRCNSDLEALERITGQFLLYAGGGESEALVDCPLDQWLAEVVASHPSEQLILDLEQITAPVRPVALGRAVANVIDNAFTYGQAPVVVQLRSRQQGCSIDIWDQGPGMPKSQWDRALQPFQRLDEARGEQGHCGLGLAIVSHVVHRHGGELQFDVVEGTGSSGKPGRFCVRIGLPHRTLERADNMQKS